jgi:hypothetical protein
MGVRIGGTDFHPISNPVEFDAEISTAVQKQPGAAPATNGSTSPPQSAPDTGYVQDGEKLAVLTKLNQSLTDELAIKGGLAGLSDEETKQLTQILNKVPPKEFDRVERLFEDALHSGDRVAAMRAFLKIEPLRTAHPDRITPDIERSLVMGVGTSRIDGALHGTKGGTGILGVDSAERAARTLINMPDSEYKVIGQALQNAGTGGGPKGSAETERALMFKAIAARQSQFTDSGWAKANAGKPDAHMSATWELSHYADAIRGKDRSDLVEKSTVQDLSSREGTKALQQRFSTSCAPTSAQITEAESDPIAALRMHQEGVHSTSDKGDIGWTQKFILNFDGGLAVPRDDAHPKVQGKGLYANQYAKALNQVASPVTNRVYHPEMIDDSPKARTAALDKMEPLLRDRIDVPIGVFWDGGGGHALVMTDVAGDKPNRQFLVNDPWNGKTGWVKEDDIVHGHTDFFAGKGHLGEFFPSVPKLDKVD